MTNIIILLGDLGAGKTTLAAFLSCLISWFFPEIPQVANVTIDTARKIEDTNKFVATKLIKENKDYCFVITDEAAQAGFEARGSGTKAAALESRVITLARKAHIDMILISQLMSMIEKRAQWLGNIDILCEAVFLSDNMTPFPNYFEYTIFDNKLRKMGEFRLSWEFCLEYIFPHMDTDDIPYAETLKQQFITYFDITEKDYEEFDEIMKQPVLISK